MSDVDALVQLLPKLLPQVDLVIALHWGEFAAISAAMEHRGVPIDMEICRQLQDKATWAYARDAMVPAIDAQYSVYVRGKEGGWHFNVARFEDYLPRVGINWPRDDASGKLNLRRKTFDSRPKARPELEPLRQLRLTPATSCDGSSWRSAATAGSDRAVAVRLKDVTQPAKSRAMDLLAIDLAAIIDRSRHPGARSPTSTGLRWNSSRRRPYGLPAHARALHVRQSLHLVRQALR